MDDVYRKTDPFPVETKGGHTYVCNRRLAQLQRCEWVLDVLSRHAGCVTLKEPGRWHITVWGCGATEASWTTLKSAAERVARVLRRGSSTRAPIDVPPIPLLEVPKGETFVPLARLNYLERCAEVVELLEQGMFHMIGGGTLHPWWEVFPTEFYEKVDPPFECGEGTTIYSAVEEIMDWTPVPQVKEDAWLSEEYWKDMRSSIEGLFLAGLLGAAILLTFWWFG